MSYVICTTQLEADTLRAQIDSALGWPKIGKGACQAVNIGGGEHVTHPLCCTQTHVKAIKHPTLSLWAIFIDDKARSVAGTITEIMTLTSDWKLPVSGML
jgi:hypothetical protein